VGRSWRVASHPDWYYNLKANPRIKVEVGSQTFTALAQELDGAARAGRSRCSC
jgi:deazaflavin-dependent oxidoreductase (nitroreductase family)